MHVGLVSNVAEVTSFVCDTQSNLNFNNDMEYKCIVGLENMNLFVISLS